MNKAEFEERLQEALLADATRFIVGITSGHVDQLPRLNQLAQTLEDLYDIERVIIPLGVRELTQADTYELSELIRAVIAPVLEKLKELLLCERRGRSASLELGTSAAVAFMRTSNRALTKRYVFGHISTREQFDDFVMAQQRRVENAYAFLNRRAYWQDGEFDEEAIDAACLDFYLHCFYEAVCLLLDTTQPELSKWRNQYQSLQVSVTDWYSQVRALSVPVGKA